MACKYNVDEFKPFISNKKRIKPAPADDWRLINESLNLSESVALRSDKLDTTIYDIKFRPFINFLRAEDVTMHGDKIEGSFVIGMSRVLRREQDYNETMGIKNSRESVHIEKKDWKIGHKYESICGETVIYIGKRYTQKIKENLNYDSVSDLTKLKVSYFGIIDNNIVDITLRKLLLDQGNVLSESEAEKKLENFYNDNWEYVAFEKVKPVNYTIGPISVDYEIVFGETKYNYSKTNTYIVYNRKYYLWEHDGKILVGCGYAKSNGILFEFNCTNEHIIVGKNEIAAGKVIQQSSHRDFYYQRRFYNIYDYSNSKLLNMRLGVIKNG